MFNTRKTLFIQQKKTFILLYYLAELQTICQIYWKRVVGLEGDKYDLERGCEIKKMEVKPNNKKSHSQTKQTHTRTRTFCIQLKHTHKPRQIS